MICTALARRSSWRTRITSICGRHERIKRLGGLNKFSAWSKPILTDSGGFQVVSLGPLMRIREEGARFHSHLDGSQHLFTPERSIEIQEALGPDIAVAFDQPVMPGSSERRDVLRAMQRTHRWAVRSLRAHSREEQALFGIAQGALILSCGRSRRPIFVHSRLRGSILVVSLVTRHQRSATRRWRQRSRHFKAITACAI